MKFALVAYAILSGDIQSFVMDSGLTYRECMHAIKQGVTVAEIVPGVSIDLSGAPLVCELETVPSVTMAASKVE